MIAPSASPSPQIDWTIDKAKGDLSRQLAACVRGAIVEGKLVRGDRLPASRTLARELSLARGTVTTALEGLLAEGLLEARIGSGTYVACDARHVGRPQSFHPTRTYDFAREAIPPDIDAPVRARIDLRPCRPSLEAFPLNTWRRCLSAAASAVPSSDYDDAQGTLELREAIAEYLRRARGLMTSSDRIVITNGAVHAMHLLARIFLNETQSVVVETPGFPLARQALGSTGARIRCCGVDEAGIIVEDIATNIDAPTLVYVTPSHQFPIGSRLSLPRRTRLLEWAERTGGLIVEDDYDGEFRYDVSPLAPLAALSAQHVVYCGTFSKTMFPGLRLGFAVAPEPIAQAMTKTRAISEYAPPRVTQRALATFIDSGSYERHIHKMRRVYAAKRKAVVEGLGNHARLVGIESGLSALVELPPANDAQEVSRALEKQGILVPSLARYAFDNKPISNALVFGYAQPSLEELAKATRAIVDHLAGSR